MHKKRIAAFKSDIKTLTERIEAIERLADSVGGMMTEEDARELILSKHHDLVAVQLDSYLAKEKRVLTFHFTNLMDKYFVSINSIESNLQETNQMLSNYLDKLNYLS